MTEEIEQILDEAHKYELLDSLTTHEGWAVLLDHLNRVKSVIMEALVSEEDPKKVVTLQARYRAFSSVIGTLQSAKSIKEKLQDDIKNIIEDDKLREEFDIK